ncbi:MAG: ABC transporter ATP-binding protein, partial [Cypionkella sp.]
MSDPILEIRNLSVSCAVPDGGRTRVLHDLSLDISAGEVVALVGESGSGKTTTAQSVVGLLADGARIEGGSIRLLGQEMTTLRAAALNGLRGQVVSLIPQDPGASLNPVRTIDGQVAEMLATHGVPHVLRRERVIELLNRVGLSEPERRFDQYPHELSGGMNQRVLIAIAIALEPALIIADEPTSALDVTVQRRILDLIDDLRRKAGTAVLLVTHDLAVAADRADRIAVLKSGRVQEQGAVTDVLRAPSSAYAQQLLAVAPAFAAVRNRAQPAAADIAVRVAD